MKHSIYKTREELPMYLTVMDVADLLGISRASAYELVREQNFPKLKIVTGRIIIPRDRLLEWLDEQTRYDRGAPAIRRHLVCRLPPHPLFPMHEFSHRC